MLAHWKIKRRRLERKALAKWWSQIDKWRARDCLRYRQGSKVIKPQYAIQRLYELTKDRDDVYITTEVGQHQMWAAQFFRFERPKHWMTSGGLGTMGYGLPAAIGAQVAHPKALVIDIAGEASIMMNIQEMSTAAQHRLPVKIFIINNEYMGMVRQWQELLHGGRYSESYMDSLPDFVRLAESFHAVGLRATRPDEVDGRDQRDDRRRSAGHRRYPGRQDGELLPHDPVGRRPLRDAAWARGQGGEAGLRGRHGPGVRAAGAASVAADPRASTRTAPAIGSRRRLPTNENDHGGKTF